MEVSAELWEEAERPSAEAELDRSIDLSECVPDLIELAELSSSATARPPARRDPFGRRRRRALSARMNLPVLLAAGSTRALQR